MRKSTLAWAEKHFQMDYGLFDRKRHRPVSHILNLLDKRRGFKLVILGSAQSYKTLAVTIWVIAGVMLRSRKLGWYSKTRDSVKQWSDEKFSPSFDYNEALMRIFPLDRRNNINKTVKKLPHTILQLLAADTTIDRQQKSLDLIVCDEWWTYEPGALKEIENRTTAFQGSYVEILPSTGATVGHEGEQHWLDSDQQLWHVPCPHCKKLFPFDFFPPRPVPYDDRKSDLGEIVIIDGEKFWQGWGGCHFASIDTVRNEEGKIDWQLFDASVRWQCPNCGTDIPWSPRTLQEMDDQGEFIATNPGAKRDIVGLHSNAFRQMPWPALCQEWIVAMHAKNHGDPGPLEVFWKTRLALFWDPAYLNQSEANDISFGDYAFGEPWEDAFVTIMTVDVQQDHYWAVVRAWSRTAESRLIWAGQLLTEDHIAKIAEQFGAKGHDGRIVWNASAGVHQIPAGCTVFLDENYETSQVRRMAAQRNWICFRGDDCEPFLHRNKRLHVFAPLKVINAFEGLAAGGRHNVAQIRFSNDHARNMLATIQGIKSPKRIWTYPRDIKERCPDYLEHLKSWVRIPKVRNGKAHAFEWRKVKTRDDLFWCEKAQIVAAAMAGLVGQSAAGLESTADPVAGDQELQEAHH